MCKNSDENMETQTSEIPMDTYAGNFQNEKVGCQICKNNLSTHIMCKNSEENMETQTSESEIPMDTCGPVYQNEMVDCQICKKEFVIRHMYVCSACFSSVCLACSTINGRWIHITDDCDLCHKIHTQNTLHHTLYFVCGKDCEHLLIASYY